MSISHWDSGEHAKDGAQAAIGWAKEQSDLMDGSPQASYLGTEVVPSTPRPFPPTLGPPGCSSRQLAGFPGAPAQPVMVSGTPLRMRCASHVMAWVLSRTQPWTTAVPSAPERLSVPWRPILARSAVELLKDAGAGAGGQREGAAGVQGGERDGLLDEEPPPGSQCWGLPTTAGNRRLTWPRKWDRSGPWRAEELDRNTPPVDRGRVWRAGMPARVSAGPAGERDVHPGFCPECPTARPRGPGGRAFVRTRAAGQTRRRVPDPVGPRAGRGPGHVTIQGRDQGLARRHAGAGGPRRTSHQNEAGDRREQRDHRKHRSPGASRG